ncbi:hypothetical protein D9V37_17245 [Nocardioides mangrovicus]|uniref:SAF domain-containing protein n=1 Tax=Nocardioides mangrovicus TaxID=2478913 RepID=A0A3L8NZ68_9ACTN|nr:SAF domain-containing protein [Nocardioides mangrovicus]RLV47863.1 hypothetical protein D9V37_17245 [Nocardioides mangrovicus]
MVQSPVREREAVRGRLPAARRDRRPALAALAVLLILLGALGSALIAFRSGDRVSVLVAAQNIEVGQKVEASDFREVKVAGDTATLVRTTALSAVSGGRALVGVPRGAFITRTMFSKGQILPAGAEEVGVVVSSAKRPGTVPSPGDVVRLYFVTSSQSSTAASSYNPGDSVVDAARVVGVHSGGASGSANVTVVVKRSDAGAVAALSANGNVAMTVLPSDTDPDVDLVSPGE